ncbi:MAG: tagatose 1,6-diphosphate aldolase [Candidatus Pacebacteria bacterium]|nr:tagatose 1,6-diphosphate aldolase [Candidatus Paceibacterota bacterium]
MTVRDLQTQSGHITLAPFDQRGSLAKLLGVDPASDSGKQQLSDLKSVFMQTFSPFCSAVLVDPEFGLPSIQKKDPHAALLLSLEKSSYDAENKDAMPQFYEGWGVPEIVVRNAAVKLLLFYHPESTTAFQKRQLVERMYKESKQYNVPFLLEPLLYPPQQSTLSSFEAQLQMVRDFTPLCDVLKLEFPLGAEEAFDEQTAANYCDQITKTSTVPWILLSRGMGYERFSLALSTAMKHGAHGFAVGRAIWKEVGEYTTQEDQFAFVRTTAKERLQKLIEIVEA